MEKFDKCYFLLSIQSALLGSVIPSLRALVVQLNEDEHFLFVQFIYDCEVTDEVFDLSSCIAVEIDFPMSYDFDWSAIKVDYPNRYPIEGILVFQRYEEQNEKIKELSIFPLNQKYRKYPLAGACLAAQMALLGIVTPELRAVTLSLDEEKKECYLKFYYDQNVPENILGLWTSAISEAGSYFFPEYRLSGEIKRLDYPNKISVDGRYAYFRREL